jgi:hypothetical protein
LILLDATEPFSSPNILPLRVLNWEDWFAKMEVQLKLI